MARDPTLSAAFLGQSGIKQLPAEDATSSGDIGVVTPTFLLWLCASHHSLSETHQWVFSLSEITGKGTERWTLCCALETLSVLLDRHPCMNNDSPRVFLSPPCHYQPVLSHPHIRSSLQFLLLIFLLHFLPCFFPDLFFWCSVFTNMNSLHSSVRNRERLCQFTHKKISASYKSACMYCCCVNSHVK